MIPKVIHYCWFGSNLKNETIRKCIDSWKTYCPDYEIIEWNENNYDITKHPFMRKAYESKKWAFVSDYARIDIINQYGGIYLDTDVELIAPLESFLKYDFFAGFESASFVAFGLGFGSIQGHTVLKDILEYYDSLDFPNDEFGLSMISCPRIQTEVLVKHGMVCNNQTQEFEGCHIFSTEYFCPVSFSTGETTITEKTVSIHHYDMSWNNDRFKRSKNREWKLIRTFGQKWGKIIARIINAPGKVMTNTREGTLLEYIRFLTKRK